MDVDANAVVQAERRRLAAMGNRRLFALYVLRTRDLGLRPMRRRDWNRLSLSARQDLALVAVDGLGAPADRLHGVTS